MMFWLRGKCFDTSEEMIKYEKEWQNAPVDSESVESIFDLLKSNLTINLPLCKQNLKNHELSLYAEKIFDFAVKLYQQDKQ